MTPLNMLDLQRIAAIKQLDQQIAKDHADGYTHDVNALLDVQHAYMGTTDQIAAGEKPTEDLPLMLVTE